MDKFEEYKLLNERAQTESERRQTTSQTYLTINTAIFGAVAFLIRDSGLHSWVLVLVALSLFAVGISACLIWMKITQNLEKTLSWQYARLREMEAEIPNSSRIITREYEELYKPAGKRRISFSILEGGLPAALMGLYALYSLGIIIGAAVGWV
jgi:hypothetical protein